MNELIRVFKAAPWSLALIMLNLVFFFLDALSGEFAWLSLGAAALLTLSAYYFSDERGKDDEVLHK